MQKASTVFVPTANGALTKKIHPILTQSEFEAVFASLKSREPQRPETESERHDRFAEILESGDRAALSDKIEGKFISGDIENSGEEILTNARQYASVCECLASVVSAKYALDLFGDDIAGTELERAASAIAEMDGREVSIDVVDHIFHKFCVGK